MVQVQVEVHAVLAQRKASSACHGAPLRFPPEGAEHELECTQCGQPAERVLSDPVEVEAHG